MNKSLFKMFSLITMLALILMATFVPSRPAFAASFTPGNLVVYRVGDGAAALNSNATAVFLDEYTPAGVLVQSIALPTTVSGANKRLVGSGTSTSEGLLTRSADGQYLVLAGYDAALGTASITTSTSATVNRVIGRVDALGNVDTSTALTDAISGGNPRGAASTNGTDLWISGSAGGAIRYATLGATASTSLTTAPTNIRATNIFNGQLYISAQSSTFRLATVGTGTPTTTGQTTTNLPGYTTSTTSPYGFFFADLDAGVAGVDTVYVADDNAAGGGTGGIQKYSLVGGSWTSNGLIANTTGLRGLTGVVSGTSVMLYITNPSGLFTLTDTSGYNATISGSLSSITTAGANKAFRGVALAPVAAGPTATPTDTPIPTDTSAPTDTPTPTDTPVITDTSTNTPTDTPIPTDTSTPTPSATPASAAALVINEIDYDQVGTDTAEFVEIRNNDVVTVNLSGYNIQLINGNLGGAVQYALSPYNLPSVNLAPGDYFVLCGDAANVPNCDLDVTPNSDLVQNGSPDAVGLRFGTTLIDAVSYEGNTGAPYTEGTGTSASDSNTIPNIGLSRFPDGADTNQNNTDFSLRCITPGEANSSSTTGCVVDFAPSVTSTNPFNNETNVPNINHIDINFSEAVTVTGNWFNISCANSGTHTATVSGGPQNYTINPDVDFALSESCSVTIFAANVADQDGTPNNMAADYSFSFTTAAQPFVCGDPATLISAIQGSGAASPLVGTKVLIEGIVVGDFQNNATPDNGELNGFYVQEEDAEADGNLLTSDGIFVFGVSNIDVSLGEKVRLRGTVTEFNGLTEINNVTTLFSCSTGNLLPMATIVNLPVTNINDFERYEGMRITFPQELVISEYFNYERFGELVLALPLEGETRPFTGTAIDEPGVGPGSPANMRTAANGLRRITLDDGLSIQNPALVRHPNGAAFDLTPANRFRGGDTVANATGVMDFSFDLYRIQPTGPADYIAVNPRPAAPEETGGSLHVAAMNTLNFFLTLDAIDDDSGPDNPADNVCGGNTNLDCRGADLSQPDEFNRQRPKLLAALAGLNADIIGLNELENTPGVDPLGDPTKGVVAGLNSMLGSGTYSYINSGVIGTDAIRVGLIYKPGKVVPIGGFQILDSTDDPRFIDTRSRPALAQTFEELATGARFTVVVNHFKSKGSSCADIADPDTGDGQGNCNKTRLAAAQALVDWLATDPTGSGDPDFLIMGDLNSYAQEDPIDAIKAGSDDTSGTDDDYTNLILQYQGTYAYSFTFDGQAGYLDHALANPSLAAQIDGAADWHINSDEPDLLDYDTTFKPPAQEAIYEPNAFRSSDHDPVIVGLGLDLNTTCNGLEATIVGTTGDDIINGTNGNDIIVGVGGDDVINGNNGDDIICAGAGNDTVNSGTGNDLVFGGYGNDILNGQNGFDTLNGDSGNDTLDGGNDPDMLNGSNGSDNLIGGGSNDVLDGGADNDSLAGNNGIDSLTGGAGADSFSGGAGADTNVDFNAGDGDTSDGT